MRVHGGYADSVVRVGYYNYNDAATAITPIAVPANTPTILTNDALGSLTDISNGVWGVYTVYDPLTNYFDFSGFRVKDMMITIRVDVSITTTSPNQQVSFFFNGAIGGSFPYSLQFPGSPIPFKLPATNQEIMVALPMGLFTDDTRSNPASVTIVSDAPCSVVVNGFFIIATKR